MDLQGGYGWMDRKSIPSSEELLGEMLSADLMRMLIYCVCV